MTQSPAVILYPHPLLSRAATPRPLDPALRAAGEALLATARQHRAYGLAAAHIGLVEPVVVVSLGPPETRDYRLLFNPEILSASAEQAAGMEGSVSLPGIEVEITRPATIELAFDDVSGNPQTLSLAGFAARVAQHEIDQMNGIFFLEKLSRLKRDAALRRYRKRGRADN